VYLSVEVPAASAESYLADLEQVLKELGVWDRVSLE
jgi:hypothetical protein